MSTPPKMDVWILAGQSNMQGCGLLNDPTLPPIAESDPRIWSFSTAGNWEIAEEPLHRLWESFTPVHQNFMRPGLAEADRNLSNEEIAARERENCIGGSGLGIAFAKVMADATGHSIGLIPAAHGGTSLEQWNFNLKGEGGNSLYGGMLERVRKARESADFELKGILWYQGESDCDANQSVTYAERFTKWIEAARSDLDAPNLPVYFVQLGRVIQSPLVEPGQGWSGSAWDIVRDAQRIVAQEVPHTATAGAADLGLCDTIHIDTPGLVRLGRRLARLALTGGEGPRLAKVEQVETKPNGFHQVRVVCSGVTGGWNPRNRIPGFEIRDAEGNLHPNILVVDANADERDPKIINVLILGMDDSARLGYGLGLDPVCTVVDDADMPLPTFLPQPIQKA